MPRVSVVIPTYNRAYLIRESINSVLSQTFSDFELIIVDDGSTDGTEEAVRSIVDPRLRYLKQPNKGPSAARNTGVQAATGEYVAFLDSDDLFLPEKLSLQVAKITDNPAAGLIYGRYLSNAGSKGLMKVAGVCCPQLELRYLLLGPVFHWSTVLIRHTLLEQVGGFDEESGCEDWDLTLRLALVGCQMEGVPQPLAVIRQQPNSVAKNSYLHEESFMATLDKAFNHPRMPSELLNLQSLARASQLIRIAASAYSTSKLEIGQLILQRALETYPILASEQIDFLVDTLVYRVRGLSLDDPEEVFQRVTQYLPGHDTLTKNLRRRLWGKFYEIAAFESYQLGQRTKCIRDVIRAVSKTPSCLRNRGLISIFVRSLVGSRIDNEFKGLYSTQRRSETG